jgi:hypothetical protein
VRVVSLTEDQPFVRNSLRIVCLTILIVVPILEAFRGLDVTDTGFVLTSQRLIFTFPADVSYWFHLWLTNVIGGIVDLVFGSFGVLPHKLAAAVIFWCMIVIIFRMYRNRVQADTILVAVTIAIGFAFYRKINIIHYNNLSALFYLLGASLLLKGLIEQKSRFVFFSGFVLGLNIFIRIPNILGLGLILVPYGLDLITRDQERRIRAGVKDLGSFSLGAAMAIIIAVLAMLALGHWSIYLRSLGDLANSSTVEAGDYGLREVIRRPIRDTLSAIQWGLAAALVIAAFSALASLLKKNWMRMPFAVVGVFLVYYFAIGTIFSRFGSSFIYRSSAGLCYLAVAFIVLDQRSDRKLRLSCVLIACISLALNCGSDTGITVSTYAFPAMFPALMCVAMSLKSFPRTVTQTSRYHPLSASALVVSVLFVGFSIYAVENGIYRDANRAGSVARHPQIRWILTGHARAQVLDEALPVISSFVSPGTILFAYDSLPLVYFATKTRPYLGNSWPAQYNPKYLNLLLKRQESVKTLPVVLLARANPRRGAWPLRDEPISDSWPVELFMARNNYQMVWENSAFKLYLPPKL